MTFPDDLSEPASTRGKIDGGIGALTIYLLLAGPVSESSENSSLYGCGGGLGISADGFVFPLMTTKSYFRSSEYRSRKIIFKGFTVDYMIIIVNRAKWLASKN